jgi:hypothetical protein
MSRETHSCHNHAAQGDGIPALGRKRKMVGGLSIALCLRRISGHGG